MTLPTSYDEEAVQTAIQTKLDAIFTDVADDCQLTFTELQRRVIKLPDGSIGFYVDMGVEALYSNNENSICSSESILVVLD